MSTPSDTPPSGSSGWSQTGSGYADWLGLALEQARAVGASGDVPIGAVVVGPEGEVLGRGRNGREELADTTGQAVMDYGSLIYVALERARTAIPPRVH